MSLLASARAALSEGEPRDKRGKRTKPRAGCPRAEPPTGGRDSSFPRLSRARASRNGPRPRRWLLAAGRRAVLSPAAREDEAELAVRGEALP